jgi:hypothetical protein
MVTKFRPELGDGPPSGERPKMLFKSRLANIATAVASAAVFFWEVPSLGRTLGRAFAFITGFDFFYERAKDPTWLAGAYRIALNPPPGTALLVVIVGLVLIYWTTKPREIRMSFPVLGMLISVICFAGFGVWYLVRHQATNAVTTQGLLPQATVQPQDVGQLSWDDHLGHTYSSEGTTILTQGIQIGARNGPDRELQLENAYIISGEGSGRIEMKIASTVGWIPANETNPIPPNGAIVFQAEFASTPAKEFFENWKTIYLTVLHDGGLIIRKTIDEKMVAAIYAGFRPNPIGPQITRKPPASPTAPKADAIPEQVAADPHKSTQPRGPVSGSQVVEQLERLEAQPSSTRAPAPRPLSTYEAEQKIRVIDSILKMLRVDMQPLEDKWYLPQVSHAWNALKDPANHPNYLSDLIAYRDAFKMACSNLITFRNKNSEYPDIMTATEQPNYDAEIKAIENYLVLSQQLLTYLKPDIGNDEFNRILQPSSEAALRATQEFVVWRTQTRIKMETARIELQPDKEPLHPGNRITFDYSTNNGVASIGEGDCSFRLKFAKSGDSDIQMLTSSHDNRSSVKRLARVKPVPTGSTLRFKDFDSSSTIYRIGTGEIFLVENPQSCFMQGKIIQIKDDSRSAEHDEVTFDYQINGIGNGEFRAL